MTARYVGLTSTFDEQRLVINAIAEDVDLLLNGTPNLVAGIVTANSFSGNVVGNVTGNLAGNVTGTASTATASATAYSLTGSPNLNVGIVTATSFNGNVIGNVTGNVTGNLTGTASTSTVATNAYGLLGAPNFVAGVVTATSFNGNVIGNVTGTASTSTVSTNAYGLIGTPNINVAIATATRFFGNLTGIATNAYGLVGTPNINVANISATQSSFTGNVSIAGTLSISEIGGNGQRTSLSSSGSGFVFNHNDNSNVNIDVLGTNKLQYQYTPNLWAIPSGISLLVGSTSQTGTASQRLQVNGGAYFNGLVGLGTTNPTLSLQLSPNASISNLNANIALSSTAGTAATVAQFYHNNGNGSYLRIKATRNSEGSNWITASTKLLQVIDVTEQGYIEFNPNGSNYGIALGQGSNEYMRILNGGNVGIGITNPTAKLHVVGDSTVSGVSTANQSRFLSVAERIVRVDGNTVSIAYTSTGANIAFCPNATGDITLAVTDIPTDSSFDNHAISFTVFISQTGVARSCTSVILNGVTETIRWAGGSLAAAVSGVTTTNGYDIYNFVGINTIGSASTTTNYEVFGVVNGGFR